MSQNNTLTQYQPHALGLLRIVTGYLFIMHGTTKLFQFPYIEMFANVPVASMFSAAGIIELIGGLLIILGLFTVLWRLCWQAKWQRRISSDTWQMAAIS